MNYGLIAIGIGFVVLSAIILRSRKETHNLGITRKY